MEFVILQRWNRSMAILAPLGSTHPHLSVVERIPRCAGMMQPFCMEAIEE